MINVDTLFLELLGYHILRIFFCNIFSQNKFFLIELQRSEYFIELIFSIYTKINK